jgi:hypothetical protein
VVRAAPAKKYPEAAVILEQQVASGLIPPADLPARMKR